MKKVSKPLQIYAICIKMLWCNKIHSTNSLKKINRKEKKKNRYIKLSIYLSLHIFLFCYFSVSNSKTRIMVQFQHSKLCLCPRTLFHWKIVVKLLHPLLQRPPVKHFWPQNQPQLVLTTTITESAAAAALATTKLIIQKRR